MTGPDLLEPDRLTLAIEAYSRRFPRQGLPFLRPAGSPEGREAAIRLLHRAVARGRPLHGWAIARVLGYRRPPEGACW
jgi:hypothetical protein